LTQLRTQDFDSGVHTNLTQLYTQPWGGWVGLVNFIIGTQPLLTIIITIIIITIIIIINHHHHHHHHHYLRA
jgi:uncharacterized membrane protein